MSNPLLSLRCWLTYQQKAVVEPPSKFISTDVEMQLACRLLFVDMEGLNDGRAVKKITAQVNPRKMIIVHSSEECSKSLIDACAAVRALTKEIFAPAVGEFVQIGQQTNSYSISLSEELLSSIKMSRVSSKVFLTTVTNALIYSLRITRSALYKVQSQALPAPPYPSWSPSQTSPIALRRSRKNVRHS